MDQFAQLIDLRLTARQDAKAKRAFLRQARENAQLYQPLTIIIDKALSYAKVIGEMKSGLVPTR